MKIRNFIFILTLCSLAPFKAYSSSYEKVSQSTATLIHKKAQGSGFFIGKSLLVTNYHVVKEAEKGIVFFVTPKGLKGIGIVVAFDAEHDLAIIKTLKKAYTPLKVGNSKKVKVGDDIFVIGSPEGLGGTLSKGIISAKRETHIFQITAPISPGSSGSPVFSKDFKVIGIATAVHKTGQNLNFAVSVGKLKELFSRNKKNIMKIAKIDLYKETKSNFKKELTYYEKNKEKNPQEMFHLGLMYYNGEGVLKDYKKALYWFQKSASQGNAKAQFNLGFMYDDGERVLKDYKKASYWFQKSASQGLAAAQLNLGNMYYSGYGVLKDYKKASYWFQKSASQGLAAAQLNLGNMYYSGYGVLKDHKKSFYWYEKSASQGVALAQCNLGNMYSKGEGVLKDHKKSFYWYEKSASQGLAQAQYNLGITYYNGEGILKDYKKASYWFQKSASQGLAEAQYNLGFVYYKGEGVLKDYKEASYWYEKSASQGLAAAQLNLGNMYSKGEGVLKDYVTAYKWLSLSNAQKHDIRIQKVLSSLELLMTSSQVAEAQSLARQFKSEKEVLRGIASEK